MNLRERTAMVERAGARVLVSIHHDSVQPRYLDPWTFQGRVREYTTYARGFSMFVSARNGFFAASKDLAARIGSELRVIGKRPSVHHAEPIEGEDRQVIDAVNGVYRFDDLVVLLSAAMPAVLLEAGVIKHRDEELVVASETFQADVARSITSALEQVRCLALEPGNAPRPPLSRSPDAEQSFRGLGYTMIALSVVGRGDWILRPAPLSQVPASRPRSPGAAIATSPELLDKQ